MGERYGRVLYLKDYASYISDEMVSEFADINQNMMISIDIIPIPTDEAVNEAQNRLLGRGNEYHELAAAAERQSELLLPCPMTWNCRKRKAGSFCGI